MRELIYCKYWLWNIDLGHSTVKTTISFIILHILSMTRFLFFTEAHNFSQFCLWWLLDSSFSLEHTVFLNFVSDCLLLWWIPLSFHHSDRLPRDLLHPKACHSRTLKVVHSTDVPCERQALVEMKCGLLWRSSFHSISKVDDFYFSHISEQ